MVSFELGSDTAAVVSGHLDMEKQLCWFNPFRDIVSNVWIQKFPLWIKHCHRISVGFFVLVSVSIIINFASRFFSWNCLHANMFLGWGFFTLFIFYKTLYIILVTWMAFTNCNPHLDVLYPMSIRYKHHEDNLWESLANETTPFSLHIKKAPGIVTVTEDFHIKWNGILKSTERNLIKLLLVESENVITKI